MPDPLAGSIRAGHWLIDRDDVGDDNHDFVPVRRPGLKPR